MKCELAKIPSKINFTCTYSVESIILILILECKNETLLVCKKSSENGLAICSWQRKFVDRTKSAFSRKLKEVDEILLDFKNTHFCKYFIHFI